MAILCSDITNGVVFTGLLCLAMTNSGSLSLPLSGVSRSVTLREERPRQRGFARLYRKSKVNSVLLLIGVLLQEAVRTGNAPERISRALREPSGIPSAVILAARTDGPTQDQGSRP